MLKINDIYFFSEIKTLDIKEDVNIEERKEFFGYKNSQNEFDYIFWNSLIDHFPIAFFEEYKKIYNSIFDSYPKIALKNIYVFNELFYENIFFNIFLAFQVETFNTQLISIQHGGGYGIRKYVHSENFERHITDSFISWGWKGSNVITMPSLLNLKWKKRKNNIKYKDILYITTVNMKTLSFLGDEHPYLRPDDYNNDIRIFLNEILNSKLRLIWRPYKARFNVADDNQIKNCLLNFDENKLNRLTINLTGDSYSNIKNKRLIVIDHCSTTFLETIANNIPTILFWNKDFTVLNEDAVGVFRKMHNVGILHYSPKDAANFIKNNYDNIEEWWNNEEVQKVVEEFVENYARQDKDIISSYVKLFKGSDDIIVYKKYRSLEYSMFKCKEYLSTIKRKLGGIMRGEF